MTTIEERKAAAEAAAAKIDELAKKAREARTELDEAVATYIANSFMDVETADDRGPLPDSATVIGPLSTESRRDIQRLNALSGGINNAILEIKRSVGAAFHLLSAVEGAISKAVWQKIAAEHGFDLEAEGVEYGSWVNENGVPVVYSKQVAEDDFLDFLRQVQQQQQQQQSDAVGEAEVVGHA
jgi:hypothetical protein